jgi:hypothetical protein
MLKSFIFWLHAELCLLLPSYWRLAWRTLQPWLWREHVIPKRLLAFNGLHCAVSQEDRTRRNYHCKNFKSYIIDCWAQILLPSMTQTGANHSLVQDVISLKCLSEHLLGCQSFRLGFTSGQHSFLANPFNFTL